MKRVLVFLVSIVTVPTALTGVNQAAASGQNQAAVGCAVLALAAVAVIAWLTAQVGMAYRSAFRPAASYRRGRWTGRDGGGWL